MRIRARAALSHSRLAEVFAYVSLAGIFVLDAITPQALAIQIAYEASVVLAALTGNRKLIVRVLVAALITNLVAGFLDAAQRGYRLDVIDIENRSISFLSIYLVGALSLTIQNKSELLGRITERAECERLDAALLAAVYRFWSSLEPERIAKTVTEEAVTVFATPEAVWVPSDPERPLWTRFEPAAEATIRTRASVPRAAAGELALAANAHTFGTFAASESFGALSGNSSSSPFYFAIPIADDTSRYGVLFIATGSAAPDESLLRAAREYGVRVRAAMDQTRILEQLRLRNAMLTGRQRVMEELVEAISHDVRTPLMALCVTLDQALAGAYGTLPSEYTSVARESRTSIEGIQRLAETLLLVARFEAETPRDRPEMVRLQDTVHDVASELSSLVETSGLTLRTDVSAGAEIEATRGDVRRAISNLLANAIRNTPRGGTIELRVSRNADQVEVAVLDDGFGVAERLRTSLFQRFSKAPGESGGTGLGLYIVRRVAEESGGHVRYEARSPRGSIFTMAFPRRAAIAA